MIPNNPPLDSTPQLCSLPVIHIAPYLTDSGGHGRLSTSAALHAACREFGFFYLDLTGFVTPEETEELATLAREFFALPSEEKNKIHLGLQDNARGASKLYMNLYGVIVPTPTPVRSVRSASLSVISSNSFV
jgi:isopenicillin N synthase-like dioxygenase